jgi:DHA1 family inner membrane transport protein
MTIGTELGGRLADWSVVRTMYLGLGSTAVVLAVFPFTAGGVVTAGLSVPAHLGDRLAVPAGAADAAHGRRRRRADPRAAGQHAALNVANALGAWLGGVVIAAGLGWTAPAVVGACSPSSGWASSRVSVVRQRRRRRGSSGLG